MTAVTIFSNAGQNDIERARLILDQYLRTNYEVTTVGPLTGKINGSDKDFSIMAYHLMGLDTLIRVGHSEHDPRYISLLDVMVSSTEEKRGIVDKISALLRKSLPHEVYIQHPLRFCTPSTCADRRYEVG